MPDEVVFEEQVLTKDETEIGLGEEAVQVTGVFSYQLVENVLQNGSNLSEWEHVVLASSLSLLVFLCVKCKVFQR